MENVGGFVCNDTRYEHPYGDIIYGSGGLDQFFREFNVKDITDKNVLLLGYVNPNHWMALANLNYFDKAQVKQFYERTLYTCPYTDKKYTSLIPLAIFDHNIEQYFGDTKPWYQEMACDKSWNLTGPDPYSEFEAVEDNMSNMCVVMQGTGYTHSCIQSDGSWSRVPVLVDITPTGGVLYGSMLVWHNK